MLLKSPGLSFIAILTLAVGLGVNTAVFTAPPTALLLRPLSTLRNLTGSFWSTG